jgi:FkbM family methyltransferase
VIKNVIKTWLKLALNRGVGSQFGEDKIIVSLLPERGTYLDVGAYHPHLYSNTYGLYRKGWSGTAVEPNPDMAVLWKLFRPRDAFLNVAVGNRGKATYYMYKDGAYNGFEKLDDRPVVAQRELQVVPLSDFLKADVDFLNIDCEGMDYEILQTHDWLKKPKVITIEGNEGGDSHQFLINKGYALKAKAGMTLIYKLL